MSKYHTLVNISLHFHHLKPLFKKIIFLLLQIILGGSQGNTYHRLAHSFKLCRIHIFPKSSPLTAPKNLFWNEGLFSKSESLHSHNEEKNLKITVAIKSMTKIPEAAITGHKPSTSFSSASLPTWGWEGRSAGRSPCCCDCWGVLQWLRRREGGSLSKPLQTSWEPKAQDTSQEECSAWALCVWVHQQQESLPELPHSPCWGSPLPTWHSELRTASLLALWPFKQSYNSTVQVVTE